VSDQTQIPTWLVHVAGWVGGAGLVSFVWPGLKWLFEFLKKKLESGETSSQVIVNVGGQPAAPALPAPPAPALAQPAPLALPAHEMQVLIEHAVETALANRPSSPMASTLPPGVVSMAEVVTRREFQTTLAALPAPPTDVVTRRELQAALADVVTRREMQALANNLPMEPVATRRELEKLVARNDQSDAQQLRFREKVLQRLARILERMKITIEQEERDEEGNGT
jgi:hypothetical protein